VALRPTNADAIQVHADADVADQRVAQHTVAAADIQVDMRLQVEAVTSG
jgi:hypothetical protein